MSMQAINYALTLPVDESGPRLTLLIIAHHVNYRTGDMFVGQDELAAEVRRDERTVRRYLTHLEEAGFIRRMQQRSSDGKRMTDRIELVDYLEWQTVIEKGGVIKDPNTRGKRVEKPADKLSGSGPATGQNAPDQPDKNGLASGHLMSGTKGTIFNQDNLSAGMRACDVNTPRAALARNRRLVVKSDPDWWQWLAVVDRHFSAKGREMIIAEGAMLVFDEKPSAAAKAPALPPPVGSEAREVLEQGRKQAPALDRKLAAAGHDQ